jgi:hypothetical protein
MSNANLSNPRAGKKMDRSCMPQIRWQKGKDKEQYTARKGDWQKKKNLAV